ncbi:MAG TPA: TetR/AcrR family transcriptional regulator [Solirubrobacteraceae bacterium]|nr:TetR/AcrR family transcriptional regulator [Solirubrobacteraceae bacterium]
MANDSANPALLNAARRAFERHGYTGATLERIAAEAGLSRVTLHRRGITKDGLLEALITQATEDYRRRLWPALTTDGTGAQRLAIALHALCDAAEDHIGLLLAMRAHNDALFHRSDQPEALTRTVFTEPLERLLRDGIADGTLREVDPVQTATVLFNMVGWTYVHLRAGHAWNPRRARTATLDPVLHGLLVAGRPAP